MKLVSFFPSCFPYLLAFFFYSSSSSYILKAWGFSPSFGNSVTRVSPMAKTNVGTFVLKNKNGNLNINALNHNNNNNYIRSTSSLLKRHALKKSQDGAKKDGEVSFEKMDGSGVRIGIVRARWNPTIIDNLNTGIKKALTECKVKEENIFETTVPGSWELPLAVRFLAMSRQCDVIIAVGCLIKGETMHFEYIADSVSKGLMDVQLQSTIPCIFGVLTTMTEAQATDRSTGK